MHPLPTQESTELQIRFPLRDRTQRASIAVSNFCDKSAIAFGKLNATFHFEIGDDRFSNDRIELETTCFGTKDFGKPPGASVQFNIFTNVVRECISPLWQNELR